MADRVSSSGPSVLKKVLAERTSGARQKTRTAIAAAAELAIRRDVK